MKPSDCASEDDACKLSDSGHEVGNWWMLTDGYRVTLAEQNAGDKPKQAITIDPKVFNKFVAWWQKDQAAK